MDDLFKSLHTLWNMARVLLWVVATGMIGIEFGVWLLVSWALYYLYLLYKSIAHIADNAAMNFHIPVNSHDTGVLWILNGNTSADGSPYIMFAIIFMLIVFFISGIVGGIRIATGNLFFWMPILILPIYMYNIGLLHYYPGGSSAFVEHHYSKTCSYDHCQWSPITTTQPF